MSNKSNLSNLEVSDLPDHHWRRIRNDYHLPNTGMDLEKALEVLFEVDNILKNQKVDYYLSCGTVLGLRRDGNFIEWDDEIDIDILSEVFVPKFYELREVFLRHGFIVRSKFRGPSGITSKMAVFKSGIKVAFGSVYLDGNFRKDLGQKFPKEFYDNFEMISFKGRDFKVPGPVDDYLTYYYGDWKTPIKSYDINEYLNKDGKWKI